MPDKNSHTLMTWCSAIGRLAECDRLSAPAVIARIGARGEAFHGWPEGFDDSGLLLPRQNAMRECAKAGYAAERLGLRPVRVR
jgi:hypothetical protein